MTEEEKKAAEAAAKADAEAAKRAAEEAAAKAKAEAEKIAALRANAELIMLNEHKKDQSKD